MSNYKDSLATEAKGKKVIMPYLRKQGYKPRWLNTKEAQIYGDIILENTGELVELKTEWRNTNNLFLETWSSKSTDNPGWIRKIIAQYLYYYFLDTPNFLFIVEVDLLLDFVKKYEHNYKEKEMKKCKQLNKSFGLCVPQRDLIIKAGMKKVIL